MVWHKLAKYIITYLLHIKPHKNVSLCLQEEKHDMTLVLLPFIHYIFKNAEDKLLVLHKLPFHYRIFVYDVFTYIF